MRRLSSIFIHTPAPQLLTLRPYRKNWLFLEADTSAYGCPKNALCQESDERAMLVAAAVASSARGDGDRTRKGMSVDTIEDIAVLGALLVFSSLSLAVIVLLY